MARIAELICYPIKGCAGTSLLDTFMTPAGLAHDRSFMVVDERGVFRTQRRDPRLALIRPDISADGKRLTLRGPGVEAVSIEVDSSGPRRDVDLFGATYKGIDQGDVVAEWLSEVFAAPRRLVRVPPEHDRVTDGDVPGTSGYADSSAVHVLSLASLDELNQRLAERGAPPHPMNRFRPNVVVSGWEEPHTEDRLRRVVLGGAELGFTKLAIRCAVTTVDQETGLRTGPEPLRTLAEYRRTEGGIAFGAKFAVLETGKLSVGDEVVVTAWAERIR
ncbi:MOSC N-terminal beta barrel domain-containing protein [Saccharopolyspora erythraea]|uniref:MOSC domain-containing protein n=1 Tax=Saccharopolyspora erythraea TaxID=1836 RepID=UPI001BA5E991|nr:MOSC N-terminal beta barrel domain-containing protein [Saccharopolyspora erythraea]QUG99681.1 MOSC N-terminal beta barrel domain-containing protein [Saccharopolyspora erythraea]